MKSLFSKHEKIALTTIFLILVAVSVPNFIFSLRRARDQVRRDDLGSLEHGIALYYSQFGVFPMSSTDGKVMNCIKPGGEAPYIDKYGKWVFDLIGCEWGEDPFVNLVTGETYISVFPRDPDWQKNVNYYYISDGERYQLFASMEGQDEPEVSKDVISQGVICGGRICNVGRSYNCDIPKTIKQCSLEANELKKLYH